MLDKIKAIIVKSIAILGKAFNTAPLNLIITNRQVIKVFFLLVFALCFLLPDRSFAILRVHPYECKVCHVAELFQSGMGNPLGNNVCLQCHQKGTGDTTPHFAATYPEPLDGIVEAVFSVGDASNLYGNGNGSAGLDKQTSHNWSAPLANPKAGAEAPSRSSSYGAAFYSRYGTSSGYVTCTRCHDPHGDLYNETYSYRANPKLLQLGSMDDKYPFPPYNSTYPNAPTDQGVAELVNQIHADLMCQTCHKAWVINDHGWLSHPIIDDYNASVATNPEKYHATLKNKGNADINLVFGGVSCTSCHGVHHVDSDSTTVDGPGQVLNMSDGKLLRGDGPLLTDKSSLCQTCHTYMDHGDNTGEKVGCLICHSGHSYDPSAPNYFVLRKTALTATYNLVNGLDYSSPDVLDEGLKYTYWNDQTDGTANGYCEKCHGDAASLPGSFHSSSAVCTDCHKHDAGGAGSFGHGDGTGDGDCTVCHAAVHNVDSGQADWITFFDNGDDHTWDAGYTIDTYATCTMCHVTNLLPTHADNCATCHFGPSPPRESFTDWNQTCQQGSCHPSYHPNASPGHDNEYFLGNCSTCHDATGREGWSDDYAWDLIARVDFCGECHAFPTDTNPPVSQSDLLPHYIDDALVSLTTFDPWGIQSIYYRLNGGVTQTYSGPITVAAPVSGTQPHILEFWAADKSGNVESANSEAFTVTTDTTPPVTLSNSKGVYGTDATITLTPTDDATSFPVATTYYVLDDPDGVPSEGTTVVIPEPVSGSEAHTLYFWSVDHAGNVEDPPKEANFTIIADGQEHTVLDLGETVYFITDPGATGPRVSYQIYIDDVLQTTIARTTEGPYTATWNCPEIAVSPGSHIDIVVNAWLINYTGTPVTNAPRTFTLDLPDDAVRLEAASWNISMNMQYEPVEYEPGYGDFAYVEALPATVENIVYLTTTPDKTPPVTTSNITSGDVYAGNQTFTLTPTDSGTGVEQTWWQLDGTGGTWIAGTNMTVSSPVSGTAAHTLYWYSKDYAGNQETIQSVSFNLEALGTTTLTLPLDAPVEFAVDAQGASGPRVRYQIYIDDVLKGTLTKSQFSTVTTWACPQTSVTTGSHIDVIVDSWFTNYTGTPYTNAPHTFTLNLPAGIKRIETATWTGLPNLTWATYAYDEDFDWEYDFVAMPTGTIGNIVYAGIGSDSTPPVTTIDATGGATYVGDQVFTLSPTDTDSGVESTWWELDGSGIWNIGTTVSVAAPTSGTDSHTITWYSRDNDANQEAQQTVTFNMQP